MPAAAHWADKEKDSRKPIRGPRGVRSLAYLALDEKRPIFRTGRICETRRALLARRVFLFRVCSRCLVVPHPEHDVKGTPFLFLRPAAVPFVRWVRKNRNDTEMNLNWPNAVAMSWVELASWLCSILLGVLAVFRGLYLFQKSNDTRRADLLKSLLDEYNGTAVADSIRAIDEGNVVYSEHIKLPKQDAHSVRLADPALLFFSNVCYLHQSGLLTSREFEFFKWKIQDDLEDANVCSYVASLVAKEKTSPYKRLLRYKKKGSLWNRIRDLFYGKK